jgi:uncharacterized protein
MIVGAENVNKTNILWRRLDLPGHEAARITRTNSHQSVEPGAWLLEGTATFLFEKQPCLLDYQIICGEGWQTRSASVRGWVGDAQVALEMAVNAGRRWWLNNVEAPTVAGCIDLDLNFSPVTNLLPIRRLGLSVGQSAEVRAAWLRFPSFTLEPLEQVYTRVEAQVYRYESSGGLFSTLLTVNEAGLVTRYPNYWETE